MPVPAALQAARDKLILALDVANADEALAVAAQLKHEVGMFKVGKQLFTAAGPTLVRRLAGLGVEVFLDLKFHDIPQTVAAAAAEATRLGVFMFNVHALGGSAMMRKAADACRETAAAAGARKPLLLAVTVLTSMDRTMLQEVGIEAEPLDQVLRLARLAQACGMDGVVASPQEVPELRRAIADRRFCIVTPGVRPLGSAHDDQSRVMTPAAAVAAGSDYLVVGRAILGAADPVAAARNIVAEMAAAF